MSNQFDYSMGIADDNPNLPAAVEFGDGRKVSEEFFEVMYQIATEKGVPAGKITNEEVEARRAADEKGVRYPVDMRWNRQIDTSYPATYQNSDVDTLSHTQAYQEFSEQITAHAKEHASSIRGNVVREIKAYGEQVSDYVPRSPLQLCQIEHTRQLYGYHT